jgi:hypothetical protein
VRHDNHHRHPPDRAALARGTGLDIDKSDIALARSFKIIDPGLKNPGTAEWERAFALFDLLI